MAAITEGRVFGVLAVAQPDLFLLFQGKLFRTKPCALVIAITHWLMTTQTTGAPPVVTGFEFETYRLGFKNFGEIFHRLNWGD